MGSVFQNIGRKCQPCWILGFRYQLGPTRWLDGLHRPTPDRVQLKVRAGANFEDQARTLQNLLQQTCFRRKKSHFVYFFPLWSLVACVGTADFFLSVNTTLCAIPTFFLLPLGQTCNGETNTQRELFLSSLWSVAQPPPPIIFW